MYGKYNNGSIEYAPSYIIIDGEVIHNFNTNIELMLEYGYKEIIEVKPQHDPKKEALYVMSVDEGKYKITIYYDVFTIKIEADIYAKVDDNSKNINNLVESQNAISESNVVLEECLLDTDFRLLTIEIQLDIIS